MSVRNHVKVTWTGASFVPEHSDMAYCQYTFMPGEVFTIDPERERDMNSHRHYFVQLKEAFDNLPEKMRSKYPTEEIFRRKLLIEAGYFHEQEMVCDSEKNAHSIAAFMAPLDPSAVITVHGPVIRTYVAMSQSLAAMGRKEFQNSKWAVLDRAASLIRVTPKELAKNAGKSA